MASGNSLQCQGRLKEALEAFRQAVRHRSYQCRCPLQSRNTALRARLQCRSACRAAPRAGPRSWLRAGARQSRRIARTFRLPNRGGVGKSNRDRTGAGPTSLADQPGRGPVFARPPCRGRGLLSQGADDAAGLCLRPWQSAVRAQLPHRPHRRSDLCRIPGLGPPSREAPRIGQRCHSTLDRTPGRRLRVGYVSADFRQHAVAMFAEPLLAAHDRSNVELYLYAGVAAEDATTERFRSLSDHWRSTIGLSDAKLAELIRADQIDVLVDLAGHSAGNRLLTFARRPAPVQVAYLLGHGYSTGLSAMDAFLADAALAPEGADALFSERLVRLPRIPLAYAPPDGMPPVAPLPALTNGFITFGHFGRTERLNDTVIAAWARILHAVPRSRLILNNRPIPGSGIPRPVPGAFRHARHRPEQARPGLFRRRSRSAWAAYGGIDIALDPFPAQCRHDDHRGTVAGRAGRVPGRPTDGRPVRRQHPARGRTRRLGHRRHRRLRGTRRGRRIRPRRARAIARGTAAAGRRIATARRSRPGARHRGTHFARCGTNGARAIVARLHRLYAEGDRAAAAELAQRMLRRDAADAEAHHVLGLLAYRDHRLGEADAHLRCGHRARSRAGRIACQPRGDPAQTGSARRCRSRRTQRAGDWNRSASPRTTTWATSCATSAATMKAPTAIVRRSAWRRISPTPGSICPGCWHWPDTRDRRRRPPARPSPATQPMPMRTTIWGWR